jgi:hypothetical protein
MKHTRVLAIFANPTGSSPLRLGAEDRVIRECVTRSRYRENIDLEIRHAATIHDLRRALLEKDYRIVQFSGHGTGKGLAFEDEQGKVRLVPPRALAELLAAYSPPIECVILNACYSNVQGQIVSSGVPFTIGMDGPISDEGATEFTRGFYDAIGAGKGIEFAYQEGCRTIKLMGLPDGIVPMLFTKSAQPVAPRTIEFAVQVDDVVTFDSDVLALKIAHRLFGADKEVAGVLGRVYDEIIESVMTSGGYALFPTSGSISAQHVLFVSVGYLYDFDYEEIRRFAGEVLKILTSAAPSTRHLAMTIHGVGYGLDEAEALRSQLAGYLDAFDSGYYPSTLQKITIVDRNQARVQRLRAVLNESIPGSTAILPETTEPLVFPQPIERSSMTSNVGRKSAKKPHVFVAMPFSEEMDDVYYYGIHAPVNAAGYLCERADLTAFTGDILERIKSRIETAALVIAELTTANPNVFLEVGYAWGKDRPTILLAQETDKLPFDIRGQRCLAYKRIRDLEEALARELHELKDSIV